MMPLDSENPSLVPADVLDRGLDKGIVIDAAVRVSVVGVELLGVDASVVVASIDAYLRHADALAYTSLAAAPPSTRPDPPLLIGPAETPMDRLGEPDALPREPLREP